MGVIMAFLLELGPGLLICGLIWSDLVAFAAGLGLIGTACEVYRRLGGEPVYNE